MKNLKKINLFLTALAAVLFLSAGDWIGTALLHHPDDPAKYMFIYYYEGGKESDPDVKDCPVDGTYFSCVTFTCLHPADDNFCGCIEIN
jgi:hypothetical protein